MLTISQRGEGKWNIHAAVNGLGIYLDNHSYIALTKDASLQERFTGILQRGSDLIVSLANVAEFVGPQGQSADSLRALLHAIGPNWFPLELDTFLVVERELRERKSTVEAAVSADLVKIVAATNSRRTGNVGDTEAFHLDVLMDGLLSQRDSIRYGLKELDTALISRIQGYRERDKKEPGWLNQAFPLILPPSGSTPANVTYCAMMRELVRNRGYQLKENDGIDLSHAVLGSTLASVMTLDTHWKGRVERLPKPNTRARVYHPNELERLITDVEHALSRAGR